MKKVFVANNNIISSLGFDTTSNIANVANEVSGIKEYNNTRLFHQPFCASLIDNDLLNSSFEKLHAIDDYTRLEQMMILSLNRVLLDSNVKLTKKTGLLITTTKGNIDVLEKKSTFSKERAYLTALGESIQLFFGFENKPIIISNACVSGILAIAIAKRLINAEQYENVLVVGGDIVSEFVLSGFTSFQAISNKPCKPFSKNRNGITIGEAAAAVLVSSNTKYLTDDSVAIVGEGSCNDANHISGPSRTGEGLYRSIQSAISEVTNSKETKIDYISAHGTATPYNDEMEAIALDRMQLANVPVNSLKGYYGHTLGAAGLLETIVGMQSLYNNHLYTSLGFDEIGVSKKINVIEKPLKKELTTFLKTASGFGGCNTAVLFKKFGPIE